MAQRAPDMTSPSADGGDEENHLEEIEKLQGERLKEARQLNSLTVTRHVEDEEDTAGGVLDASKSQAVLTSLQRQQETSERSATPSNIQKAIKLHSADIELIVSLFRVERNEAEALLRRCDGRLTDAVQTFVECLPGEYVLPEDRISCGVL